MDESAALDIVAVRAIESADTAGHLWSDQDRAWASRAAAEVVGGEASPTTYLSRRATLVLEKLRARESALVRGVHALRWRPWVGAAAVALAFALGLALDQVGGGGIINVLAPPVWGLLAWNLAVYAALAVGYVIRFGESGTPGPLRRTLTRMAAGKPSQRRRDAVGQALQRIVTEWSAVAAPLYGARAARMLHLAAAALAAGVIAGLYLRGLVFEYRATWQSTFLDAADAHRAVAILYSAGAWITGVPIPSVAAMDAIRAPASANAAVWVHLAAATVALLVIVPRGALALAMGLAERVRAQRLPLSLESPYFQRLLRGYRGGPARVRVIPYSYGVDAASMDGLEALIARTFGGSAALLVTAPQAYGDERPAEGVDGNHATTVIALFNATATPERETHGAFLAVLATQRAQWEALVAFVDEAALRARWPSEPERVNGRREAWQHVCAEADVPVAFADLGDSDVSKAQAALEVALAGPPT